MTDPTTWRRSILTIFSKSIRHRMKCSRSSSRRNARSARAPCVVHAHALGNDAAHASLYTWIVRIRGDAKAWGHRVPHFVNFFSID